MSAKLLVFVFLVLPFYASGQRKEDIYLKHNVDKQDTVLYSCCSDGRNKQEITYTQKFSMGVFSYYKQYFQIKPNSMVGEITEEDLTNLNVVKIDYFLRKREATEETQFADPNDLLIKYTLLYRIAMVNTPSLK